MTVVRDIEDFFEKWAPKETAADWDNVGLQVGDYCAVASKVLVALDIDRSVWNLIADADYDVVITHHPLLFSPIKSIDVASDIGRIIKRLMKKNITVLSHHTNLDVAKGGVNDHLVASYGLDPEAGQVFSSGFGKWFELNEVKPISQFFDVFPSSVRGAIGVEDVKRIAFCAGSGKSLAKECREQRIDLFITGEFGYHESIYCDFHGIKVLELGHKESEALILHEIKRRLEAQFSDLDVTVMSAEL